MAPPMQSLVCDLMVCALATAAIGAEVQLVSAPFAVGERIAVSFDRAARDGRDWIGIYPADRLDHHNAIAWRYTNGTRQPGPGPVSGTLVFLPLSLLPGSYQARYFVADSYRLAAWAGFQVENEAPQPVPPPCGRLTVMTFNLYTESDPGRGPCGWGGLPAVASAIAEADPDIVGLDESSPSLTDDLLKLLRADPRYASAEARGHGEHGIISRLPILAEYLPPVTPYIGFGVKVEVAPGSALRFFTDHLSAGGYGPYLVRDGTPSPAVLDQDWTYRGTQMRDELANLIDEPANEPQLATILVGDHNGPSRLDWVPANADQDFGRAIAWWASSLLQAAGFIDAFRSIHPDPTLARGLTWSAGYPKGTLDLDEVHDRIDFVYLRAGGGMAPRAIQSWVMDGDPWPSDHRALVASVDLGAAPPLVVSCRIASDACPRGSGGSANGNPDPGEVMQLRVDVSNAGTQDATGVKLTASAAGHRASVTGSQSTVGDVSAGTTVTAVHPIELRLEPSLACGARVTIDMALESDQGATVGACLIDLAAACSPCGSGEFRALLRESRIVSIQPLTPPLTSLLRSGHPTILDPAFARTVELRGPGSGVSFWIGEVRDPPDSPLVLYELDPGTSSASEVLLLAKQETDVVLAW